MPTFGFFFPVQPGKEGLIREAAAELKQRRAEYEESRRRCGISVERAYLQKNPDGSVLVVAYMEADRSLSGVMQALLSSDSALDRSFVEKNTEATGIDFRAGPLGPDPELVAQWIAPGTTSRRQGLAIAAPLQPGQTETARQFAREAFVQRRDELTESRLAKKGAREEVFLNQTPAGDAVVVYLEADDPVEENRLFAASNTPYDRWFKDRCKEIFPPFVDWDRPVPPIEEVFSWVRG